MLFLILASRKFVGGSNRGHIEAGNKRNFPDDEVNGQSEKKEMFQLVRCMGEHVSAVEVHGRA